MGKTTLVKRLAAHLGAQAMYEEFEENPWLPLFYEKTAGAELALELSFLTDRVRQLHRLQASQQDGKTNCVLSDYALDKCLLFANINLHEPYFSQYTALYQAVGKKVMQPQLVVVIHGKVAHLKQNIRERNRSFEQDISDEYLEKLNAAYKTFFAERRDYAILNIFAHELNTVAYEQAFREIAAFISRKPITPITSIEL